MPITVGGTVFPLLPISALGVPKVSAIANLAKLLSCERNDDRLVPLVFEAMAVVPYCMVLPQFSAER